MFTATAEDTEAVGARLGRLLAPGDLVLLEGELGAGKTTFTRGVARGAGFKGRVSSPTFALAHVYRGKRLTVHHLDMYRLADGDPSEVGLDDLLRDPKAAVVVEWPGAAADGWPKERLEVRLAHARAGRKLVFKARGARAKALVGKLA
ncbi:MAG: tRNA (adenosine(37)-N6)-threonylcarbamoyltransferase complex ATPase subunit type 1 TsaE [Elusimicrobiota bacterium]|nr:tRNA (adenosine(37)-N6)-threonylcarbamoyltransferase complex ATPase subunit type 1 TsaE [Elusimicrobiota bacterium]